MTNKKIRILFRIAPVLLFLAGYLSVSFAGEEKVDTTKVERFINEVSDFTRLSYDSVTLWFDKTKQEESSKLLNSFNLNDEEYFEVQRIISEQVDIRYFAGGVGRLNEEHTFDDFVKSSVFEAAFYKQLDNWETTLTKEETIMNKIMPIIKRGNEGLKVIWLKKMGTLITNIHNQKLPFLDDNRAKVMDELIEIFSDKNNPEWLRMQAVDVWIRGERREGRKYEGFGILLMDERLFEKTGFALWFITTGASQIYEKVFTILENNGKYPDGIIKGSLAFFKHDGGDFDDIADVEKRNTMRKRLKDVLRKISGDEGSSVEEESKALLDYIEQKEKEGAYR